MAIDRMDWHYGAEDFPKDVPLSNAGAHIGFFLAWAFSQGMAGEDHVADAAEGLAQLAARSITGVEFLQTYCDEKLWDDDFNEQGQAFVADYYADDNSDFATEYGSYLADYMDVFKADGDYRVADNWENYERIRPLLDQRYAQWQQWK